PPRCLSTHPFPTRRSSDLSQVQIGAYSVPLESDPSAALAYRLEGAPIWDFELAGFRRGDFSIPGNRNNGDSNGLFMLHPYHPNLDRKSTRLNSSHGSISYA